MTSLLLVLAANWQLLTVVEYGPASHESVVAAADLVAERGTRNRLVMTKVCGWREVGPDKD